MNADVAHVERLLAQHGSGSGQLQDFPGETPDNEKIEVEHGPTKVASAGKDLPVSIRVHCPTAPRWVVLHYRPLDQTVDWKELTMTGDGHDGFTATIPGAEISADWDLQYYVEVQSTRGGRLWPAWEKGPPYWVVKVAQ